MTVSSPALQEALALLSGAGTWHELRRSLQERKLDQALVPEDMQALLDAWHARRTAAMSDGELTRELSFWGGGGGFDSHLDGFQAVPPAALLREAVSRAWFVRHLPSAAVVNPPSHKPIMLKAIDVVAR
jgi:hypothetical protein